MAEDRPIFSRGQVQDVLRTRDAIKDIQESMKMASSGAKDFNSDFRSITKSANDFAIAQEKAKANTGNVNQLLKQSNDLIGRANKLTAEVSNKESQRQQNLKKISELYNDLNDSSKKNKTQIRDQIKSLENQNKELERSSEALLAAADHTKIIGGNFKDLATTSVEISRNGYGIAAGISKTLGLSHHLTDSFEKANEIQRQRQMIVAEEADLRDRINNALKDYNKELAAQGKGPISKDEFLKGKGLTRDRASQFGLDAFTEGASGTQGGKRLRDARDAMANTRTALPSQLGTLFKGLAKAVGALAKSLIVLKGIAKVVEFIEYSIFGVEKEAVELARAFTITKEEGFRLRDAIAESANKAGVLGANVEDFVKMQLEFTKQTGMVTRLTTDQLATMSLMTKQLGFSNEEAVHLTESFKAQGVSSKEGLDSLLKSYNAMKLQGNATATFKTLMHDITSDAELQSIFLNQGANAAMRQAQAVRRTGLSLSQQRATAEGLLDFEKTMSDQLELQILTGKDINLQEAQRLAAMGESGKAFRLIQKEMSKLSAAERKMPFIRDKMLGVLNMSYEQYLEMGVEQAKQAAALEKERKMVELLKEETDVFHKGKIAAMKEEFKTQEEFTKDLDETQKKQFKNSLLKYKQDRQYQKDLASLRLKNITGERAQQFLLNKKITEFSEQQINNARARAGFIDAEVKDFTNLRSTSEAFEDTMKLLKGQFASLVNQGVIVDLTNSFVDFAAAVAEVGFFKAALGFGKNAVIDKRITALEGDENVSDVDKAQIKAIKDIANPGFLGDVLRIITKYSPNNPFGYLAAEQMEFRRDQARQQIREMSLDYSNVESREKRLQAQANKAGTNVNDFILRPGQPPIKFNRGDILMGGTQLGMGNGKIESLLEELLAETKAGKVIKMDTVTVANSLRRNAIKMNT